MSVFVYILATLALLDIITTIRALRKGAVEANPIIRWLMRHGALWIVAKLAITAGATYWLRNDPVLLAAISAVYVVVVYNNWRIAK